MFNAPRHLSGVSQHYPHQVRDNADLFSVFSYLFGRFLINWPFHGQKPR